MLYRMCLRYLRGDGLAQPLAIGGRLSLLGQPLRGRPMLRRFGGHLWQPPRFVYCELSMLAPMTPMLKLRDTSGTTQSRALLVERSRIQ